MSADDVILSEGWNNTALAAGTTASVYLSNPTAGRLRIKRARISPYDAVVADNTNYKTFTLKKSSTDIVTPRATTVAGGGMTAGTEVPLTLVGTGNDIELAPGEAIIFTATHSGSGVAFRGVAQLVCERIRG